MATSAQQESLGISQLKLLDRVFVLKKLNVFNVNKYVVKSPEGEVLFKAKEDCGRLTPLLLGKDRVLEVNVVDWQKEKVMYFRKPLMNGPEKMTVSVCGQPAGVVRRVPTFFKKRLSITNPAGLRVLRLKGPAVLLGAYDFEVCTQDNKRIGVIKHNFGLFMAEFPLEMDLCYKVSIIASCILIDFLYS